MKYLLPLIALIIFKTSWAEIIINGQIINTKHPLIISYWSEYSYISDTIKPNKYHSFEKKYNLQKPMHIWINSRSSAFIMPGDTLSLIIDGDNMALKGNAAKFILFRSKLRENLTALFANSDYNTITKYAIEQSNQFFSSYKHKELLRMKKLNETELVLSLKFSPLLVAYNNNLQKVDSIRYFIMQVQLDSNYVENSPLLLFLNKITFKEEWLNFHETLNTFNNFVKIIRFNNTEDQKPDAIDSYLIDKNIITSVFHDDRFVSSLLSYNLYERIMSSPDIAKLIGTKPFIEELKSRSGGSKSTAFLLQAYQRKKEQLTYR